MKLLAVIVFVAVIYAAILWLRMSALDSLDVEDRIPPPS